MVRPLAAVAMALAFGPAIAANATETPHGANELGSASGSPQPVPSPDSRPRLFWYDRVGGGVLAAGTSTSGLTLGFGTRYEQRHLGLDVSVLNLFIAASDNGGGKLNGAIAKAMGLCLLDSRAPSTPFVGMGFSLGSVTFLGDKTPSSSFTRSYSGRGAQGELVLGYERTVIRTARLFIQMDGTVPFYRFASKNLPGAPVQAAAPAKWGPTVAVSIGLGMSLIYNSKE
jgi:hypothetical protein